MQKITWRNSSCPKKSITEMSSRWKGRSPQVPPSRRGLSWFSLTSDWPASSLFLDYCLCWTAAARCSSWHTPSSNSFTSLRLFCGSASIWTQCFPRIPCKFWLMLFCWPPVTAPFFSGSFSLLILELFLLTSQVLYFKVLSAKLVQFMDLRHSVYKVVIKSP